METKLKKVILDSSKIAPQPRSAKEIKESLSKIKTSDTGTTTINLGSVAPTKKFVPAKKKFVQNEKSIIVGKDGKIIQPVIISSFVSPGHSNAHGPGMGSSNGGSGSFSGRTGSIPQNIPIGHVPIATRSLPISSPSAPKLQQVRAIPQRPNVVLVDDGKKLKPAKAEKPKKQRQVQSSGNFFWKLIAATLALAVIGAAVATPVVFFLVKSPTVISSQTINKIQKTAQWKNYASNTLIDYGNDIEGMQAAINSQKANWKNWIVPLNSVGKVLENSIESVDEITVSEKEGKIYFAFNLICSEGFQIEENKVLEFSLIDTVAYQWNNDAATEIQKIIRSAQPYNSVAQINSFLNLDGNTSTIKNMIKTNQTDIEGVDRLTFTVSEIPGTDNNEKHYRIATTLIMKSKIEVGTLPDIENLYANMNIAIGWSNYNEIYAAMQSMIGSIGDDVNAIKSELERSNNTSTIKSLITNGDKIDSFTYRVVKEANGIAVTVENVVAKSGYQGSTTTLPPVTALSTPTRVEIKWNSLPEVKTMIQTILNSQPFADERAMQAELEKPANIDLFKTKLFNNQHVERLTFIVKKIADNNFTATPHVLMKEGFIAYGDQIGMNNSLSEFNSLTADLLISINWNNYDSAKRTVLEIVSRIDRTEAFLLENELELSANQTILKNMLSQGHTITNLVFKVTQILPRSYTIEISSIILKPGFVMENNLSDLTFTGMALLTPIEVVWENYDYATRNLQVFVNMAPEFTVASVTTYLQPFKESIIQLFKGYQANKDLIIDFDFRLDLETNNTMTYYVTKVIMRDGYINKGTIIPINVTNTRG